jgi:D-glycero-D-manno-heptose 1,7-bisphosphate phosphatase
MKAVILPMENKPAVFFDRDGVLNKDIHYLYKIEEFGWIPGAIETIQYFNKRGYYVFVITNQSGVARGYYTEDDVRNLHEWMNQQLALHDAHIDDFFYCPHHIDGTVPAYTQNCSCRKPYTGMLEQAKKKYSIDMKKSLLIGDKESDIECAKNAGILGVQFTGDNLYEMLGKTNIK